MQSRFKLVYYARRFWVVELSDGQVVQIWGPNGQGFWTQSGAEGWLKTVAARG